MKRSVTIRNGGKKPPLFWVSPGFRQYDVISQLAPGQPIYGVYAPEPKPDGPPLRFDQIAAYYVETILSSHPHGPYALTGWCAGAAVSFEIARQLQSRGEAIRALIMIDPLDPGLSRAELVRDPALFKVRFNFHRALFHLHKMEESSLGAKWDYCTRSMALFLERLKGNVPLPAEVLHIKRPDLYAFRNYLLQTYAGSGTIIRPHNFKYAFEYANRRWAQLMNHGLEVQEIPGDYESMWVDPGAGVMSRIINFCLS